LAYPDLEVVGIDISRRMIEYARASAQEQGLSNVTFRVMDVLKPLDFPDHSFDLVNARLLFGFMPPAAWPALLAECMRVTRSGGMIRLTECESDLTTSAATQQLMGMVTRSLQLAGRSFSPDGRHFGILPMLGHFLRQAGCQEVQSRASALDWSAGMEANASTRLNLQSLLRLLEPFLVNVQLITEEEFEPLYQAAVAEMQANDFCAVTLFLSAWGKRPLQRSRAARDLARRSPYLSSEGTEAPTRVGENSRKCVTHTIIEPLGQDMVFLAISLSD
jgi:Methyltransferase domain